MTNINFVGDIHGEFDRYEQMINKSGPNDIFIQVGDFGIGFDKWEDHTASEIQRKNPFSYFIRGNHDDPVKCKQIPGYIHDGTFFRDMMFIGGAWSIDHAYRTLGIDWWPDEELSMKELNDLIDKYEQIMPEIMITHTCPAKFAQEFIINRDLAFQNGPPAGSRTEEAFEIMFEIHQPKKWIFGHWHVSIDETVNDTNFRCLAPNEILTLKV